MTDSQTLTNPIFHGVDAGILEAANLIAEAFLKRGQICTTADVVAWYEGFPHGDASVVERHVVALLGPVTVEYFDSLARLDNAVMYRLGITTERCCGGIDLEWAPRA